MGFAASFPLRPLPRSLSRDRTPLMRDCLPVVNNSVHTIGEV
jgi:hypothetical protein